MTNMQIDVSTIGPKKSFMPSFSTEKVMTNSIENPVLTEAELNICKRNAAMFYSNIETITQLFSQLIKRDMTVYRKSSERKELELLLKVNFNDYDVVDQLAYKDQSIVLLAKVHKLL